MSKIFSRFGRDGRKKKGSETNDLNPAKQRWEDAWTRTTVEAEEIQGLIRRCTEELKQRALDIPFFLLPFRPASNPSAVRTFIRRFFDSAMGLKGDSLTQELRMTDPMVVCGIVKWCWSRMAGGIVGWDAYKLFKVGEKDSNFARDSFKTFIPLSVENGAKSCIIFDFFDLLSAIAAHAKVNGMGGRKLSRMAAWWTFDHCDTGQGFDGGYNIFLKAADATSHLFFAYLRSLTPVTPRAGISILPMSMQKLLEETEYPPQRPELLQYQTHKIAMHVNAISPTPFSLLRRASHFQFRDSDRGLKAYSEFEDPIQALTEECRRVLKAISSVNQSQVSSSKISTSLRDASWSRFEDLGFSTTMDEEDSDDDKFALARKQQSNTLHPIPLRTTPASNSAINLGRPTTPSWADFMSSGFDDGSSGNRANLLLPPDKVLPPIETTVRQHSSQSHHPRLESNSLEPGELASISNLALDDCFWWVWISSLGPEETSARKSSFGRCAVIETEIKAARWLVIEELVVGAGPDPKEGAYIAEKKGFFSWTRKTLGRSKSTAARPTQNKVLDGMSQLTLSKTNIGPDQQARIQAAAAQLQARQQEEQYNKQAAPIRRGRTDAELMHEKTNSIMTVQTFFVTEASSALKWANRYDKDSNIRSDYLNNSTASKGESMLNTDGVIHTISEEEHEECIQTPDPVLTPTLDEQPKPSVEIKPSTPASPSESKKAKKLQKVAVSEKATVSPSAPAEKTGGFKKLFSRRNRSSEVPDNAPTGLGAMSQKEKVRMAATPTSPAFTKEATSPGPGPAFKKPALTEEEAHKDDAVDGATTDAIPEPIYIEVPEDVVSSPMASPQPRQNNGEYEPSLSDISTDDAREAEHEFSHFDQGPLVEQPAFAPESDSDDAAPPPIPRHAHPRAPSALQQEPPSQIPKLSANGGSFKLKGRVIVPEENRAEFEDERWARLRKNAQERAMQRQRQIPVRAPAPRPELDSDTSGEETIESRVARIKARVAELTNNMEGAQGSGVMASPVRH